MFLARLPFHSMSAAEDTGESCGYSCGLSSLSRVCGNSGADEAGEEVFGEGAEALDGIALGLGEVQPRGAFGEGQYAAREHLHVQGGPAASFDRPVDEHAKRTVHVRRTATTCCASSAGAPSGESSTTRQVSGSPLTTERYAVTASARRASGST